MPSFKILLKQSVINLVKEEIVISNQKLYICIKSNTNIFEECLRI